MKNNIKIIKGNLFTSGYQTLVNTVNCYGEMGAGIALEYRYRYPDMYEKYVKFCDAKQIEIGKLWIYKTDKKWILNFPTKKHWRFPSKIEFLTKGLQKFLDTYNEQKIESIAFPLLGAQNGGLDPKTVKEIMFEYLSKCEIPVEIYEYDKFSKDDLIETFKAYLLRKRINDIKKEIDLDTRVISKIQKALDINDISTIIELRKVSGIGDSTLSKIYNFLMLQNQSIYINQTLFDYNQLDLLPKSISMLK
ncbi:MAG: protein with ADP-ribose binding module, superfamily [Ignavibacteria bacterium]|nr:protein with ADP-ribose binding module, superfamily [Ignavibacteria bacterium]